MSRFNRRILEHLADRRYQPTPAQELAQQLHIAPDELEEFLRAVEKLLHAGQLVLNQDDSIGLPPPGQEMVGIFRKTSRGFGFIVPDAVVEHGDLFVPAHMTLGALTGDRVRARVIHDSNRASGTRTSSTASPPPKQPGIDPASAAIVQPGGRSPYIGRIVEILQRAQSRFVGNLRRMGSHWVVEIDGQILRDPVIIRDPHAKTSSSSGSKAGNKVVVELLEFPKDDKPATGVIVEVLGEQGEPDVETLAVMRAYQLAESFPAAVLTDARTAAQAFDDTRIPPDREDLTQTLILTIDPPDARDFDDAISIRRLPDAPPISPSSPLPAASAHLSQHDRKGPATWELGVHIAHVAHFVKKGTALDDEAYRRANSTYLPKKVVPMLPEVLSNGVCSLQEAVNRYCLSVFLRYDDQGHVLSQRFAKTVIRSAKRLTYLEAQALIDNNIREAVKHARSEPKYPRPVIDALQQMNMLSQIIRQRRMRDGMIVLGLPEVELVFDDTGRVIDAVPEDTAYTHTLIEMFMVEANEAAARVFNNLQLPMIRRIHADPPMHDIEELRQYAKVAGYNLPARPDRHSLQQLLECSRGKPTQYALHLAVLKTLSRAEYSPELIGHFALASKHYTHFTSPIRRYPDLVVHRGLDAVIEAMAQHQPDTARQMQPANTAAGNTEKPRPKSRPSHALVSALRDDPRLPSEESLFQLGKHCSLTERNSEAAEDDLRTYLVLDLLRAHMGEDYEGTVTGVTREGVYIQLDKYLVDGFVRSTDLPGQTFDRWRLNRQTGALVAMRSGNSIRIGDRFVVRIANVNPSRRQLEMVIVSRVGKAPQQRRDNLPESSRKQREERQRIKRDRRGKRHKKRRK